MQLSDILVPSAIRVPLAGDDKRSVIAELVDLLADTGAITDRDAVLRAVLERERTRTTGIGEQLAIPHGKSTGATRIAAALGVTAGPVDFASVDGEGVRLVVLLASPAGQTGPHIQALARISRMLSDRSLRRRLIAADSPGQILAEIRRNESAVGA